MWGPPPNSEVTRRRSHGGRDKALPSWRASAKESRSRSPIISFATSPWKGEGAHGSVQSTDYLLFDEQMTRYRFYLAHREAAERGEMI